MSTIQDLRTERERYWSQSRVGLFLMCSLKYAFSYVYRAQAEFTPLALAFGSSVHRTLEMMAHSRMDGSLMPAEDCRELFAEIWRRQLKEDNDIRYGDGQDSESCMAQGQAIVGVFHANSDPEEEVLRVSEAMAVPLIDSTGQVLADPLIGELDLLVRDGGGRLVIVDWKTAARKWLKGKADSEIQPTALLYAFAQHAVRQLEQQWPLAQACGEVA